MHARPVYPIRTALSAKSKRDSPVESGRFRRIMALEVREQGPDNAWRAIAGLDRDATRRDSEELSRSYLPRLASIRLFAYSLPSRLPMTCRVRSSQSHPSGAHRLDHDRRRPSDRRAEHVRDEDRRRRGDGRPGRTPWPRPGPASCGSRSTAAATPRRWRDPRPDDGQPLGRPAGELPAGRRRGPARSTRSATTRATSTTTSASGPGRTRSDSWSTWPASTTARCAWA